MRRWCALNRNDKSSSSNNSELVNGTYTKTSCFALATWHSYFECQRRPDSCQSTHAGHSCCSSWRIGMMSTRSIDELPQYKYSCFSSSWRRMDTPSIDTRAAVFMMEAFVSVSLFWIALFELHCWIEGLRIWGEMRRYGEWNAAVFSRACHFSVSSFDDYPTRSQRNIAIAMVALSIRPQTNRLGTEHPLVVPLEFFSWFFSFSSSLSEAGSGSSTTRRVNDNVGGANLCRCNTASFSPTWRKVLYVSIGAPHTKT